VKDDSFISLPAAIIRISLGLIYRFCSLISFQNRNSLPAAIKWKLLNWRIKTAEGGGGIIRRRNRI